jgi:VCBS repeat-containing protein
MTTITSQILSQQMIEDALQQPDSGVTSVSLIDLPESQSADTSQNVDKNQIEIQAIQQALLNENFDFSELDAPAAGNPEQRSNPGSESTFTSPVLVSEDSLLISFRSSATDTQTDASTLNIDQSVRQTAFDELTDTTANTRLEVIPSADRINGFVSEDFISRTQGNLDTGVAIQAQNINTTFGSFSTNDEGAWRYELNNDAQEVQALASGQTLEDKIILNTAEGESIELIIAIQGNNDQAVISGQKTGSISALPLADLETGFPTVSGKLNVSDVDNNESSFNASTTLTGNFGNAEITAAGDWRYTLDNDSQAIQGLRSGEKLLDMFSVKTLDGTRQLIQITIEGTDDAPLLGGNNIGLLDLASQISSSGSLTINDPDFGESRFIETSDVTSSLGYGVGAINAQGEWQFTLDPEFAQANPISNGETRIDSFDIFTADGTRQTINIPIQGSDQPLFAQINSTTLTLDELISEPDPLNEFNFESAQTTTLQSIDTDIESAFSSGDALLQNGHTQINDIGLI